MESDLQGSSYVHGHQIFVTGPPARQFCNWHLWFFSKADPIFTCFSASRRLDKEKVLCSKHKKFWHVPRICVLIRANLDRTWIVTRDFYFSNFPLSSAALRACCQAGAEKPRIIARHGL